MEEARRKRKRLKKKKRKNPHTHQSTQVSEQRTNVRGGRW
jgi:hypothetical protein